MMPCRYSGREGVGETNLPISSSRLTPMLGVYGRSVFLTVPTDSGVGEDHIERERTLGNEHLWTCRVIAFVVLVLGWSRELFFFFFFFFFFPF